MSHDQTENALRHANRAIKRGNLVDAERWSKVADQLARAAARTPSAPPPDDSNEEERRAELRRRLARFVAADQDIQAWERARDSYYAALHAAVANNGTPPPPLRPHPAGPQGEEAYMREILIGEEPA